MIIDGIFASEALDSSAEILDVEGADISTLPIDGVLNFEHRNDQSPGASPNDIVGKVIYAKKIFKLEDCENERQRRFYETVKLPIIYGIARLFDETGHPGAVAAAAIIRDQVKHKEPLTLRFSIEGSTLSKEGNRLKSTVCRRVALTAKPCNRSAISEVLHDDEGKTKQPDELKDALDALGAKKSEDPYFHRLGHDGEATVIEGDLEKAMSAGGGLAAPGALTGGAALSREHIIGAVKGWDKKKPLREHLKRALPDADEDFIEKLAQMTEDAYMPKKAIQKTEREETVLRAMRKLEAISIELKKATAMQLANADKFTRQNADTEIKTEPTPTGGTQYKRVKKEGPKAFAGPISFGGKQIQPGHMVRKGKNYAVLGHTPTHYLAVPHEKGMNFAPDDIRKVPRDMESIHMVRPLHQLESPAVLNAMQHGVFNVNRTPEQHKLIHGVDLNAPAANAPKSADQNAMNADISHWRQVGDKKMGYVKKQSFAGPFNDARRETVFHNLAREYFGLGAHVPRSAVFQHPHSGEEHVVIEKAKGEHPEYAKGDVPTGSLKGHQHAVLDKLQKEGGKLDRMGIMDMVLNNHDRHSHNYMIDSKNKNVNLIDHGFAMDAAPEYPIQHTPAYITHHNANLGQSEKTTMLHPEAAQWAHSLSPDALVSKMQSMGVPQKHIDSAVYRLKNLQDRLAAKGGKISQQEMLDSPSLPAGVEVQYPQDVHQAQTREANG